MKRVVIGFCLLYASVSAAAKDKDLGVGFVLGDPTALSVRHDLNRQNAVDAQLGFFSRHYLLLYGDYLFLFHDAFGRQNKFIAQLTPYVGVGGLFALGTNSDHDKGNYFHDRDDRLAIGVRVPVGVEWRWDKVPLGVGLEIAPGIAVIPGTTGFINAGLSLRYYF